MKPWWVEGWLETLRRAAPEEAQAGFAAYARRAKFLFLEVEKGTLTAKIDRGLRKTCFVRIAVPLWPEPVWEKILDMTASEARLGAALASGTLPDDLEARLVQAGTTLFPAPVTYRCSECEEAEFCKHLAALWIQTGEALAASPQLLFLLRGRAFEDVLRLLREKRALPESERKAPSVRKKEIRPEPAADFWTSPVSWKGLSLLPMSEETLTSLPAFLRDDEAAASRFDVLRHAVHQAGRERMYRDRRKPGRTP